MDDKIKVKANLKNSSGKMIYKISLFNKDDRMVEVIEYFKFLDYEVSTIRVEG